MQVQLGHAGDVAGNNAILAAAFSPDGRQVVTGSTDTTARLWDVASGREIRAFQGHTGVVRSVAFSPDGNQVLTASGDGTLRFWKTDTGALTRVVRGQFLAAVFSPDGKQVLTAGDGVRLWDAATGNEIRALPTGEDEKRVRIPKVTYYYYPSAAFAPDGKQIVAAGGPKTRLWDAATGKELRAFPVAAVAVAFSPDGKQVLTAGGSVPEPLEGGKPEMPPAAALQLWDAASAKEIRRFPNYPGPNPNNGSSGPVAFSPDGKWVMTTIGRTAFRWDVAGGERRRIFEDDTAEYRGGSRTEKDLMKVSYTWVPPLSAVLSPDGTRLLVQRGPRTAVLVDAGSGKEIRTFEGPVGSASAAAFTPDGRQVVVQTAFSTTVWDRANAKKLRDLKGPWDLITDSTPRLPGRVQSAQNRQIRVAPTPVPAAQRMAISPDLKQIATLEASPPDKRYNIRVYSVRLWDTATGKATSTFPLGFPHLLRQDGEARVSDLTFSADGKRILAWCIYGGIRLAPGMGLGLYSERHLAIGVWDLASGKQIRYFMFTRDSQNPESAGMAALSPDGTKLLTGGLRSLTDLSLNSAAVVLFDVASGKAEGVFLTAAALDKSRSRVCAIGFSPDGKRVLVHLSNGKMQIFDAASTKLLGTFPQEVKDNLLFPGEAFAFSPDGRHVFTWRHSDLAGHLWDAATGAKLRTFEGNLGVVNATAFSPDGKQLLTANSDGTARLWDAASGRELCRLMSFADGSWAAATPENYYTASRGNLRGVAFSLARRSLAFDQFDLKFNRPDKVIQSLGLASPDIVAAYQNAYQKRLKRMHFTEDMLSDDFHVPEIAVDGVPKATTTEKSLKLRVRGRDSKYLLDRLHVDVNGVPLHGTGGIDLRQPASKTCDREIQVELSAGHNQIEVSVLNEKGAESLKETLTVNYDTPPRKPALYVVTVGVSDYQDSRFRLTYADKDARDLADLFTKKRDRYADVKVRHLLNREATRENILKTKDFLKAAGVDDLVVLFFAGHGLLDSKLDYYFATADIDFIDPARRGLPYDAIEDLLDGIRARKKLLLMDTCHSGELDREEIQVVQSEKQPEGEIRTRGFRGLTRVVPRVGLNNSYQLLQEMFADLRRGTGAVVIASAGGAEYALESATWKNGVFTHALLRGLRGEADRNRDGHVQVSELRDFVEQEVQRLTAGRQSPAARRENLVIDFTLD